MCKHKLAIIKASTDIPWDVMLEFFSRYYGYLQGEIEAMFELSVSINSFEDGNVDKCRDNINNTHILKDHEENMGDATNIGGDIDNVSIQLLKQTQPFKEGCLLVIENLQDDAREKAIWVGLLLVQQLQAMMTKTLTDVKQIRDPFIAIWIFSYNKLARLWIFQSKGWKENNLRYYDGYIFYMTFTILTTVNMRLNAKVNILPTMFEKNRRFVTNEPVELEK